MKYRKKPVIIEAIQFNGNFDEIEKFVGGDAEFRDGKLLIATLEGPLRASNFDWIIKGIKGEFYPCKPDIFEQTYEKGEPSITIYSRTVLTCPHANKRIPISICKNCNLLEKIEYKYESGTTDGIPTGLITTCKYGTAEGDTGQ